MFSLLYYNVINYKTMDKELKENLEGIVKTWAANNMRASCYSDMEVFVNTMEEFIDCIDPGDTPIMQGCVDEVEYFGIEIDEDVFCEIDNILREEAKYWLNDYYKHKKDYDPEVIKCEF